VREPFVQLHGNEIVANTRRLCLMNMFLRNTGEIDGAAASRAFFVL